MRIEVWTDVVCPFCYIGKRELQTALAGFEHSDEVDVVWRAFELDPDAPAEGQDTTGLLMDKYQMSSAQVAAQNEQLAARAAEVGLTYNWRQSKSANTLDAHRLVKLADTEGLAEQATERLMQAYFTDGLVVSDHDVLVRIGTGIGLAADRVRDLLNGVEFAEEVHTDQSQASQYGIQGVPFFLIDGQWAVSGAHPAELFQQALDQVWDETHRPQFITLGEVSGGAGGCGCGSCGCGANG
ncbi:MAG: DsbA family oxidoreductase [Brooklawnia sp.]|uniref:DsbA family oxidoreductase n=1 Tax=Brooklawnia sp. TaxID=2699740 RepID=UPI003C749B39